MDSSCAMPRSSPMPLPLRRLFRASGSEWRDLLRAQRALLAAAWRLRREPLGSLAGRAADPGDAVAGDRARALALSTAVRRAARYGLFRPFCLAQSLALRDLLEREGIHGSTIRIGVRRSGGRFEAHAWIRWGDLVLGDEPSHVARFSEVNDLRVLERR